MLLPTDSSALPDSRTKAADTDPSEGFDHAGREHTQTLQQAQAEIRAILATVIDGFWMADRTGRILDVNAAYCRMVGYCRDELLTMNISDLEVADLAHAENAPMASASSPALGRRQTRQYTRDGQILDIEISASFMPMSHGRQIAFLRNVTEDKAVDAALCEARRVPALVRRRNRVAG